MDGEAGRCDGYHPTRVWIDPLKDDRRTWALRGQGMQLQTLRRVLRDMANELGSANHEEAMYGVNTVLMVIDAWHADPPPWWEPE